ncbi:hypothetical protein D6D01_01443 [Aureobasidium pullulans]|uniref:Uncharacterized protein n=1 Tax=Aureobasidium pullulans TaxID=5580 RepID=A0A4S9LZZ3_AURPU|nr:hypothetical protein D6D01_01443 [Aureobasidium pullulans]
MPVNPPAPLNVTPSRARNKLALRLAARKKEAEESSELENEDPDTADAAAIQQAFEMPVQPLSDLPDLDLSAVTERQINELIGVQGGLQAQAQAQDRSTTQAVVSAYSSSSGEDNSSSEEEEEDDDDDDDRPQESEEQAEQQDVKGDNVVVGVKRRPSTTEAKKRIPLDDDDDGEEDEHHHQQQHQQRFGLQRQMSDPFESPEDTSSDEESSGSSEGEELSFGRERPMGTE